MPKILRILLTGFCFVVFGVGSAVMSWGLIPLHRFRTRKLSAEDKARAREDFFLAAYRWIVGVIRGCGLIQFRPPPLPDGFPRGRPYVLVSNHPSLLDVLLIKATIPGITCLVKESLFRKPHLRPLLEASGDFRGPDMGSQSVGATAVLDTFVERLNMGHPVLVFPEGTRSPAWKLHRFRRGALEAAARAGVDVLPIFLLADPPTLKKTDRWYNVQSKTTRFEVQFLPRIDAAEAQDSRAVCASVKEQIQSRLEAAAPPRDPTDAVAAPSRG